MKVGIRLKSRGARSFSGYTAKLTFLRQSAARRERSKTADVVTRTVPVSGDGSVTLDARDAVSERAMATLVVIAPDGSVAHRQRAPLAELVLKREVEVKPLETIDLNRIRPAIAALRRFEGRLVCEYTQRPAGGVGVSVAVRTAGGTAWNVVFAATTNADGRFSGFYEPGAAESARLRAGATEIQSIPVSKGMLTSGLTYTVRVPSEERDCAAADVPRAPESEELAESGNTYSGDLRSDSCVDFRLKPDRSLHEMRYWAVVRTTVPDVRRPATVQHGSSGYTAVDLERVTIEATVTMDEETMERIQTEEFLNDYERRPDVTRSIPWELAAWPDGSLPMLYGQAETVAFGHVLGFKQSWHADGYSLGELLYSLPLAPCQKKQIAIVDWDRRDSGSRMESRTFEEGLVADLARERSITEGIASSFDEMMSGGSSARSYAASASAGLFGAGGFLGVSAGYSGSDSNAWQDSARHLSSEFANVLHDRTMQAQSAVRSQRATVIETVSQAEDVTVQTEVVANHNHCHALTVQYFQVLRHFVVRQELESVRECVFVPLDMSWFTPERAHRFRDEIRAALLDRQFEDHFRALARHIRNVYDPPSFASQNVDWVEGDVELRFQIPRPKDDIEGAYIEEAWTWFAHIVPFFSPRELHARFIAKTEEKDRAFREHILPIILENFVDRLRVRFALNELKGSIVSRSGDRVKVRFRPTRWKATTRESIRQLTIRVLAEEAGERWLGENAKVQVRDSSFWYRIDGENRSRRLCSEDPAQDLVESFGSVSNDGVLVPCQVTDSETRLYAERDNAAVVQLLEHLNAHLEYYHRAIWLRMDPQRRFMLLDQHAAPHSDGRSLASVVDNSLIGVVGNCLVMPVAPGIALDPRFKGQEGRERLKLFYNPPDRLPSMRFTAPTKGVFAEAVMGYCNSCERKDDTRFWRWEESPCPDEPTPIATVDTASRNEDVIDTKPTEFPQPIVQVQNAPAAPDPTGLAGAIAAVSQPFRDIAGLAGTQESAAQALQATLNASQTAAIKAADLLSRKLELDQLPNQLGEIEKAFERKAISGAERNQLTHDLLRNSVAKSAAPDAGAGKLPPEVTSQAGASKVTYHDAAAGIDYSSSPVAEEANGEGGSGAQKRKVLITLPSANVRQDSVLRLTGSDGTTYVREAGALASQPNGRVGFEADVAGDVTYKLVLGTPSESSEIVVFQDVKGSELSQSGFNLISKIGELFSKTVKSIGRVEITDSVEAYAGTRSRTDEPEVNA